MRKSVSYLSNLESGTRTWDIELFEAARAALAKAKGKT